MARALGRNAGETDSRWQVDGRLAFVAMLVGAVSLAYYAHTHGFALDIWVAARGFSILEVLEARENIEGFARDFPGGARLTTANVATTYLYIALYEALGLSGLSLLYGMILFEIVVIVTGAWFFWSALLGRLEAPLTADPAMIRLGFVWVALILTLSSFQRANMANFGFPYFHGQFYGFADGLRLAALGFALKNRWCLAGILLAIGFTIHPIKALIGGVMAAGIAAFQWRSMLNARVVLTGLAVAGVCAVWSLSMFQTRGDEVPIAEFVDYTRALQSHWYPMDLQLFGVRHLRGLSPFTAILIASALALAQPGWQAQLRRQIALGYALLLGLIAVGTYVSIDETSIALIRLCLLRASNLISLTGPFLIVAGAWVAWKRGDWLLAAGLLAFPFACFHMTKGFEYLSIVFALGLIVYHCLVNRTMNGLLATALVAGLAALAWLLAVTSKPMQSFDVAAVAFGTFLVFALLLWFASRFREVWFFGVITVLMFCGGYYYAYGKIERSARKAPVDAAYLDVQLWAKQHTEKTALFMVDPCRVYGWRDFSGRPSVGTIREWYMTSWIYLGGQDVLERGQSYAAALGFDMEPFRERPRSSGAICKVARPLYYDPALTAQKRFAAHHAVDYFVFDKRYANTWLPTLKHPLAFENQHFAVLAANELKQ